MNYAIQTTDLTKRYSGKTVVNKVNMNIPEGSVYGFIGENGSGKTTIMRLLMDIANPSKGTYSLFGVSRFDKKIYSIRSKISAIVEAPSLVPTMTAVENLTYACAYYGIKDLSIIPQILKTVGLNNVEKKKVKNFSLGMRQRMGIAVLLLNKPQLMLLDEPMNGLDPAGIKELRDLIIDLNKQGITFLISSHILSELEKVATYYGFISHGKLLKEISAEDLALECQKGIDLKYKDLRALESALNKIKVKKYKNYGSYIRVFDDVTPLELLTALHKEKIDIIDIKTIEANVEDYYLSLIGGSDND